MTDRSAAIDAFLSAAGWGDAERRPLKGDASFRRYERIVRGAQTAMLMDAPPAHEDVRPFVAIDGHLRALGFNAPEILARDIGNGFLLLEDFGDTLYSAVIRDGQAEEPLYRAAVDVLAGLHRHPAPNVPPYDAALLLREAKLLTDWYLPSRLGGAARQDAAFDALWLALAPRATARAPVLVLRDYHADNLMWLPDRAGHARVGLLDFQDGVAGHPAYDLASLLQDARRDVPPALESAMIDYYLAARPDLDSEDFRAAYAILGAQRNTKIIGIFTRLARRDNKAHYLPLIPRVWGLLERDLAHPALAAAKDWFDTEIPPTLRAQELPCPA